MGSAKSKVNHEESALSSDKWDRHRWNRRWSGGLERRWSRRWSRRFSFDEVVDGRRVPKRRSTIRQVEREPVRPYTPRSQVMTPPLPERSSSIGILEVHSPRTEIESPTAQRRSRSTSDVPVVRRDKEMPWRPLSKRPSRKQLPKYIGPVYSHQIAIPVVEEVLMQPAIPQKKEKGRRFVPKKDNKHQQEPPAPFIVRKVPEVKTFYLSS